MSDNPCCTGTDRDKVNGYVRHKRNGEKACPASKKAWRTYYAKRRGKT